MTTHVLDCGHAPSGHETCATGYGTDSITGKTMCYDCCTASDREALKDRSKPFTAYVNQRARTITNWPGRELMRILDAHKVGGSIDGGTLLFVRAVDVHGGIWSGRGPGDGMYIHLHPRKR